MERAAQLESLEKYSPMWRGGDEEDVLTTVFRNVADMKIRQLDEVVQLSAAQRQKLEFVSKKTIVPNLVRRRIVSRKLLKNFGEIIKNPEAEPLLKEMSLTEAMNLSTARLPQLFADDPGDCALEVQLVRGFECALELVDVGQRSASVPVTNSEWPDSMAPAVSGATSPPAACASRG